MAIERNAITGDDVQNLIVMLLTAQLAAENMRMMLIKLARKPECYTQQEIEAAVQRWWPTSCLREMAEQKMRDCP